ncbi:hypothetical protein [Archaeoglobus fulgidus]|jgi:hypothetical protein|uniref:Uncharacterized protein AF_0414 n=3 Tax=Archaeoglobus fulgidus TaxID=2234 RepID=Y414_ARCFU|nr:hypothetical protein [Archaeoglobus fulgidus]O29833.1 RecName: Full=Uncharacterized protein AF_0414 [Archaeoglobus fulgidus DSM 4304]AAB90831.1 predicted coding region AF_0414 [Archaeoglobus fulgidus DSM 4304]AIG97233.1 hypothetical protein AFULGI_00004190 [Archaeoglobus fulgidus DSM 8774]KUJ94389.1 MAG: hypothetical protein XD40_0483 [Archaeoglobus fulgidus]KUK06546.1 MAG: Uncharacterized protein XD48_1226 [Archaeoglobus fulgidus]
MPGRRVRKDVARDVKKPDFVEPVKPVDKPEIAVKKAPLRELAASITLSALSAKKLIDMELSKIRKEYEKDEFLRNFPLPGFEISEMELELNFAVDEVKDGGEVIVSFDEEKLSKLSGAISKMKMKIVGKSLQQFETIDGQKIVK